MLRLTRKRWTICTISILLIFYKTKEITRSEEHQEAPLNGYDTFFCHYTANRTHTGSLLFHHAAVPL